MTTRLHLSRLTPQTLMVLGVAVFVLGTACVFLVQVVWTAMAPPIPLQVETRVFTPPPRPADDGFFVKTAMDARMVSDAMRSLKLAMLGMGILCIGFGYYALGASITLAGFLWACGPALFGG